MAGIPRILADYVDTHSSLAWNVFYKTVNDVVLKNYNLL